MSTESDNLYAAPKSDVLPLVDEMSERDLAGRGARLAASIIDTILMMAVTVPLMFALGIWTMATEGKEPPFHMTLLLSGAGMVSFIAFHGYLLSKTGQTLGKKAMGIAIVSAENGQLIPLGKILGLRLLPLWIINLIPIAGQILPMVDVLFIFREDRRCLHDLIAGTKVISVK